MTRTLVALLGLTGATQAIADEVEVKLCFRYETHLEDAAGGDLWQATSPQERYAHGILAKVSDVTDPSDPDVVFDDFTNRSWGCTPHLRLDTDRLYEVKMYSIADAGAGNVVEVRNNPRENKPYFYLVAGYERWQPADDSTQRLVWRNSAAGHTEGIANVLASQSYALRKRAGDVTGRTFTSYAFCWDATTGAEAPCGSSKVDCTGNGVCDPVVELSTRGKKRKFMMTHETGHALLRWADENETRNGFDDYAPAPSSPPTGRDSCVDAGTGHHLRSLEVQERAASEGFAHFFAASVWNRTSEESCAFMYYKGGRDASSGALQVGADVLPKDGVDDASHLYDCESRMDVGGPARVHNYALNACFRWDPSTGALDPNATQTVPADVGSEMDWLRFLWDLHTNGAGIGFTTLLRSFDRAQPQEWGAGVASNQVVPSLRAAALQEGIDPRTWDALAELNGISR